MVGGMDEHGDVVERERLPDELQAERDLIGLVMVKPGLLALVEEEIGDGAEVFRLELHERLYEHFCSARDDGYQVSTQSIGDALGDWGAEEFPGWTLGQYVAHIAASCHPTGDDETVARDIAKALREAADLRLGRAVDSVEFDEEAFVDPPFKSKFGGKKYEEISWGADPYDWVVEDIIPAGEAVMLYGDSGSGKTFSMFALSMAIATNNKWYEWNVDPGLVIYVAAEAGRGFSKRKEAYALRHGAMPAPVPFYLLTRRPDFFSSDVDCDELIKEVEAIKREYPQHPLRMIVLDTLSAITPGANESASADTSRIKVRVDKLRLAARAAVAIVHHKPKGGTGPRGHGSLVGDYETTVDFRALEERDSQGRVVHEATLTKQREGRRGMQWRFCLEQVEIGRNKWGGAETSCVVVPVGAARVGEKKQHGSRLGIKAELFFKCLLAQLADSPVTVTKELADKFKVSASVGSMVKYPAVVKMFLAQSVPVGEDVDDESKLRGQIKVAAERLRNVGAISVRRDGDDVYVWPTGRRVRFSDGRVWPEPPEPKPEEQMAISDQELADFIGD